MPYPSTKFTIQCVCVYSANRFADEKPTLNRPSFLAMMPNQKNAHRCEYYMKVEWESSVRWTFTLTYTKSDIHQQWHSGYTAGDYNWLVEKGKKYCSWFAVFWSAKSLWYYLRVVKRTNRKDSRRSERAFASFRRCFRLAPIDFVYGLGCPLLGIF